MRNAKRGLLSLACALALVANGAAVSAQQRQPQVRERQPGPPPERDVLVEKGRIMISITPGGGDAMHGGMVAGHPGDPTSFTFNFVASEMSFDSRVVKGAPFSAESVTEAVQVLADGNRISHKTTARMYRDGEGRTRREQSMNGVGPFAAGDDAHEVVFINDAAAGVNYVLNPRERTASKMSQHFSVKRIEGDGPPKQAGTFVFRSEGRAPGQAGGMAPIRGGTLNGRAKNSVIPVYPAVAKAAGAEGMVAVEIVVNEDGKVESAKAVEGHPLLHESAVNAARQWEFAPTRLSGNPVKVTGKISFNFTLSKENAPAGLATPAPPPPGEPPPPRQMKMRMPHGPAAPPRFEETKESLGKQSFDGVEAEGTRTTVTIPAGAVGNERAILITSERWYSAELQMVVMTKHTDPRFGETSYRLTNITRAEPDRSLFEVPAGFTITPGGPFERHAEPMRMRRPKTDQ